MQRSVRYLLLALLAGTIVATDQATNLSRLFPTISV